MSKSYRPWSPEQAFLLPPSPLEWLPEDHLAYFVLEIVRELDLGPIEGAIQAKDPRGERPYSPRMMTGLLLYAYCTGTFSSRKIARATYEDVAFRVLAGGAHPFFTTVNQFRLTHRDALARLFTQVLALCQRAGMATVGHIALDGSKVQANASKHKAMSHARMTAEEKRLQAEIEALLKKADEVDSAEDAEHGDADGSPRLPEELRFREARLERIREAKLALEREAAAARAAELRENAAGLEAKVLADEGTPKELRTAATMAKAATKKADELSDDDDDDDDSGSPLTDLPRHRVQTTSDGEPKPKAQRNFTDPESRIMVRNGVFLQAYNAQAAVSEDQLVVAHGVTNANADAGLLIPMLERVHEQSGAFPKTLSADNGYLSDDNIRYCTDRGIEALIALRPADEVTTDFPPRTVKGMRRYVMQVRLKSERGRETYARRKVMVEPVFGQIKAAMGFRRFSLRGIAKVSAEWGIVCTCHNLLKLFRRGWQLAAVAA